MLQVRNFSDVRLLPGRVHYKPEERWIMRRIRAVNVSLLVSLIELNMIRKSAASYLLKQRNRQGCNVQSRAARGGMSTRGSDAVATDPPPPARGTEGEPHVNLGFQRAGEEHGVHRAMPDGVRSQVQASQWEL